MKEFGDSVIENSEIEDSEIEDSEIDDSEIEDSEIKSSKIEELPLYGVSSKTPQDPNPLPSATLKT